MCTRSRTSEKLHAAWGACKVRFGAPQVALYEMATCAADLRSCAQLESWVQRLCMACSKGVQGPRDDG